MIAMLDICGGVYASDHVTQHIAPADRAWTWETPRIVNRAASLQFFDEDGVLGIDVQPYPADAYTFQDLDPEAYEAVLNSPEKWQELVDRIKQTPERYMKCADGGTMLMLPGVESPLVMDGEDWFQFTAGLKKPITVDILIKVAYLIFSDGEENGRRFLIMAKDGKPFRLKGAVDLQHMENTHFFHSEIGAFAMKNITKDFEL